MMVVDVIREFAHGLKLGARHAFESRSYTEQVLRPSVRSALRDRFVGSDEAGH